MSRGGGPVRLGRARRVYHVRPTYKCTCSLTPGNEVTGGVALGVRLFPTLLVGAELYASTAATGDGFAQPRTSPSEVLLGGHLAVARDWTMGLGAAPGTDGAGSPSWRFVVGLQYYPAFTPPGAPHRRGAAAPAAASAARAREATSGGAAAEAARAARAAGLLRRRRRPRRRPRTGTETRSSIPRTRAPTLPVRATWIRCATAAPSSASRAVRSAFASK